MATTPPTELPPFPDQPGTTEPARPGPMPTELPSPGPDIDYPDPASDPGGAPIQPTDAGMTGDFA